jgi:D-xylose transport system ATP-binding protein
MAGRWIIRRPGAASPPGWRWFARTEKRQGLMLEQSVGFNLSLSSLDRLTRLGLLNDELEVRRNQEMFSNLRVRPRAWRRSSVNRLSGGNQQKVVLGKVLLTEPKVIFLDEPTRGIDVGAKQEVYELVNRLTDQGKAVVLVSSELPELMGMSDRILMLSEGRVGGLFDRGQATQEQLLRPRLHQRTKGVNMGTE